MLTVSFANSPAPLRVGLLLASILVLACALPVSAAEESTDPQLVATDDGDRESSPLGVEVDGEDVEGDPGSVEESVVNEDGETVSGEDATGGDGSGGGSGGDGNGGDGVESTDVDLENDGTIDGGDGNGGDGDGFGSGGDGNGGNGIEATTVVGDNDGKIGGGDGNGGSGGASGVGGNGNGGDGIAAETVDIDNGGTIEGGDGTGGDGALGGVGTGGDGIDATVEVTIDNSGTIVGGDGDEAGDGIDSAGDVTVATNTGTIASGDGEGGNGIESGGNVAVGINDGLILGIDGDGINAGGNVDVGINTGTVTGGDDGINAGSTVAITTNNGLIQGTTGDGIQADGAVDVDNNSGDVLGGDDGIDAGGNVDLGVNSGNIGGGDDGIDANGLVDIGVNSGVISGAGDDGISAASVTIGTNVGSVIGADDGISTVGTAFVAVNDGLIQGTGGDGIVANGGVAITTNSGVVQGGDDGIQSGGVVTVTLNAGDGLILGNDDGINANGTVTLVTNAGTIQGTTGDAINTDGSAVVGTNAGTIVGGDDGINADGTVTITANDGQIVGTTGDAINAGSSVTVTTNSGLIQGGDDGINADGNVTIGNNTGSIVGGDDAVNADFNVTITSNQGTIQGTTGDGVNADANVTIAVNTGTILGGDDGIDAGGAIFVTSQDGIIQGISGDGINAGGNVAISANTGSILGGPAGDGIEANGSVSVQTNSGTIAGGDDGIDASAGVDIAGNAGTIVGGNNGITSNGGVTIESNDGTIQGNDGNAIDAGGSVTIESNTGTIFGTANGVVSSTADVTNSGLIAGGEDGIATVGAAEVTNQAGGVIAGDTDLDGSGDGLDIGAGSVVVNESGARICAGVSNASCGDPLANLPEGPATDVAGIRVSELASIDNAGIIVSQGDGIRVTGATLPGPSAIDNSGIIVGVGSGINIATGSPGGDTIDNTGLIGATEGAGITANAAGTVTVNNNDGGIIVGGGDLAILGGSGTQAIFNNEGGTIAGDVVLQGGDDEFHMETGSDLLGDLDMGTTKTRDREGGGGEDDLVRLFGVGADGYAGDILGAEHLVKDESGTWSLEGSAYIGISTAIDGGALSIDGLLESPTVDVNGGGTLAGRGTVLGDVFVLGDSIGRGGVAAGGILFDDLEDDPLYGSIAPGASVGTLFVDGNVFFDGIATAPVDHDDDTKTPDVEKVLGWGGQYIADVEDNGSHDVLYVTGTTELGGRLDIVLDPEFRDTNGDGTPDVDTDGCWIPTADFTETARIHDIVVSEGGVIGNFDDVGFAGGGNDGAVVIRPDDPGTIGIDESVRLPMFKGFLETMPDRVRVISIPAFGPQGETMNQVITGTYIDGFTRYGLSTDALHERIAQLGLTFSPSSLDQLNPERYNAVNEVGFSAVRGTVNVLDNRGWEMQNNASDLPTGAWFSGSRNASEVDSDEQFSSYEFDTTSAFLGFDRLVSDGLLLGVVGSFHDSDVEFEGFPGGTDAESLALAGYLSFSNGAWFASAATGLGRMSIDGTREISLGLTTLSAMADYDGEYVYAHVKGGRGFDLRGDWWAGAGLGVTLTEVEQDPFVETGADELNLAVAGQSHDSLRATADVRISRNSGRDDGGRFTPHFTIGVSHEFEDDLRPITASVTGAGGLFTVFGSVPRKTTGIFGAGFTCAVNDRWALSLDYAGELSTDSHSDLTSHEITAAARLRF